MADTKNNETPIGPRSAKTPVEGNMIRPSAGNHTQGSYRRDSGRLQLTPSRMLIKQPSNTAGKAANTMLEQVGNPCIVSFCNGGTSTGVFDSLLARSLDLKKPDCAFSNEVRSVASSLVGL